MSLDSGLSRWRRASWLVVALVVAVAASAGTCREVEPELERCEGLGQLRGRLGGQIRSPIPGAGALEEYDVSEDGVRALLTNPCADAIADRLEDGCGICNESGSQCESLVRGIFGNPPGDCSPCGDGICLGSEDDITCPQDCAIRCGDGMCVEGETEENCPLDCIQPCGDGQCLGGESPQTCPTDCTYSVGDGVCSRGENPVNSPQDCTGDTCNAEEGGTCAATTCGDAFCQTYEDSFRCAQDCCLPHLCNVDQPAPYCRDQWTLVRCEPVGDGNCPEIQIVEECELGCRGGACSACPLSTELNICTALDEPRCAGAEWIWTCVELPGFPGCRVRDYIRCDGICREDECVDCEEVGCPPQTYRCVERNVIELCTQLPDYPCHVWVPQERCDEGQVCNLSTPPMCR